MNIIGRRVRVGRRDEIDLVARDGCALVFVEVKTRASERYGRPMYSVNRSKRRALSRSAVRYVGRLKRNSVPFRFDVGEVPDSLPNIVGQIPLEDLDWVVDCRKQKLIPNPEHKNGELADEF